MEINKESTFWAKIFIAGPVDQIEQVCREYVLTGLCVNIKQNKYIYTHGEETGVEIELINYPKYPAEFEMIEAKAFGLAKSIMNKICCGSFTIMTPATTTSYHLPRVGK